MRYAKNEVEVMKKIECDKLQEMIHFDETCSMQENCQQNVMKFNDEVTLKVIRNIRKTR